VSLNLPDESAIIFKVPVAQDKIYIREQQGYYQRLRRTLNILLVALFIGLPWISWQGEQAILFDVGAQTLRFFAWVLYPQDLMVFVLLFSLAAFVLFYVTKKYGRVWCGFSCPQTVWTLLFNWVERRIEGTHHQSRALDNQPWSWKKAGLKSAKHLAWTVIAGLTAMVFMSYFYPAKALYSDVLTWSASALISGWVVFFAACTYLNAGWIREKMCLHMCPYSRFQSVMFDAQTKLVNYDVARGEHRGPRKRSAKPGELGDCVDCNLCVQVCPVGIDIRDGLQYECINCGLCVDACNQVMDKFQYARNLISFAALKPGRTVNAALILYGVAIMAMVVGMVVWATNRVDFEVNIARDRQQLYREHYSGLIENTFRISVLNKSNHVADYRVDVSGIQIDQQSQTAIEAVEPGEKRETVITLSGKNTGTNERQHFYITTTNTLSGHTVERDVVFIYPAAEK
jgi:cytochrome c oxidase accessory protein FixG